MSDSPRQKDDDEWILSTHVDEYDWRSNVLINAFVDTVLLAFIRAHPPQGSDAAVLDDVDTTENNGHETVRSHYDEARRLSVAREALFGIEPTAMSYQKYADLPELVWMANAYIEDRDGDVPTGDDGSFLYVASNDPKYRTLKMLAQLALEAKADKGGPKEIVSEQSSVPRLTRKFRSDFHELIRFAMEGSDLPMLKERFYKLRAVLGPVGVPMWEPIDFIRDLGKAP